MWYGFRSNKKHNIYRVSLFHFLLLVCDHGIACTRYRMLPGVSRIGHQECSSDASCLLYSYHVLAAPREKNSGLGDRVTRRFTTTQPPPPKHKSLFDSIRPDRNATTSATLRSKGFRSIVALLRTTSRYILRHPG